MKPTTTKNSEVLPKDVPIEAAAAIGERFKKDQVIIITWEKGAGITTVTTWGKTIQDSDQAANGGNDLKKCLGWDDENNHATSEKVLQLIKAAKLALETLDVLKNEWPVEDSIEILQAALAPEKLK